MGGRTGLALTVIASSESCSKPQTSRVDTTSRLSMYAMEKDAKQYFVLYIRLAARRTPALERFAQLHGFFLENVLTLSLIHI